MKAQLFSPLYTIIFASIIVSVMLMFSAVIEEWRVQSFLIIESKSLEASINLLQFFDEYFLEYNTRNSLNLTVSDIVTLSNGDYSASFFNDYNLPITNLENVNKFSIQRLEGEWVIT